MTIEKDVLIRWIEEEARTLFVLRSYDADPPTDTEFSVVTVLNPERVRVMECREGDTYAISHYKPELMPEDEQIIFGRRFHWVMLDRVCPIEEENQYRTLLEYRPEIFILKPLCHEVNLIDHTITITLKDGKITYTYLEPYDQEDDITFYVRSLTPDKPVDSIGLTLAVKRLEYALGVTFAWLDNPKDASKTDVRLYSGANNTDLFPQDEIHRFFDAYEFDKFLKLAMLEDGIEFAKFSIAPDKAGKRWELKTHLKANGVM